MFNSLNLFPWYEWLIAVVVGCILGLLVICLFTYIFLAIGGYFKNKYRRK